MWWREADSAHKIDRGNPLIVNSLISLKFKDFLSDESESVREEGEESTI
jgi:hypothetical protein